MSASRPHVPIAQTDPLVGGQLFQAHGAAGMKFLGTHGDFGTQAELTAVVEARARIDKGPPSLTLIHIARHLVQVMPHSAA